MQEASFPAKQKEQKERTTHVKKITEQVRLLYQSKMAKISIHTSNFVNISLPAIASLSDFN